MGWDISKNKQFQQKQYCEKLVRKMGTEYWVISLGAFAGRILMETKNLKEALRYGKS